MQKSLWAALLIVPLCIMLAGCPSATQQQNVAQALNIASISLQGAQQSEIAAYQQGLIPVADHDFVQQGFRSLTVVGQAADSCVKSATNTTGELACVSTASAAVAQINQQGGLYLKSDKAKETFTLVISIENSALASINAVLGGK